MPTTISRGQIVLTVAVHRRPWWRQRRAHDSAPLIRRARKN